MAKPPPATATLDEYRALETEDAFQSRVIEYARLHGWLVAHFRAAQTAKGWRTPVEGDAGFVDLVLARDGVIHLWELKSARGSLDANQRAWRDAIGGTWRMWRPSDWAEIVAVLA